MTTRPDKSPLASERPGFVADLLNAGFLPHAVDERPERGFLGLDADDTRVLVRTDVDSEISLHVRPPEGRRPVMGYAWNDLYVSPGVPDSVAFEVVRAALQLDWNVPVESGNPFKDEWEWRMEALKPETRAAIIKNTNGLPCALHNAGWFLDVQPTAWGLSVAAHAPSELRRATFTWFPSNDCQWGLSIAVADHERSGSESTTGTIRSGEMCHLRLGFSCIEAAVSLQGD